MAGALLLRQRGLAVEDEEVRFDPFLAAVPVLAAVAVGIVLLRVYPFPIRAGGWLAAKRRDLVPVLGLRNVGRHSAAVALPLLVLMLTAAFTAFASVVSVTVDRGQQDASWQEVGADYRIDTISGAGLSSQIDPEAADGVEAWADALVDVAAPFEGQSNQRTNIYLHAPDVATYPAVVEDSPAPVDLPAEMVEEADPSAGTPERPIPAIISRRLPGGSLAVQSRRHLRAHRPRPADDDGGGPGTRDLRRHSAGDRLRGRLLRAAGRRLPEPTAAAVRRAAARAGVDRAGHRHHLHRAIGVGALHLAPRGVSGPCWRRRWWRPSATASG